MVERINRQAGERIYQPKSHCSLLHEIFRIKEITGLPTRHPARGADRGLEGLSLYRF